MVKVLDIIGTSTRFFKPGSLRRLRPKRASGTRSRARSDRIVDGRLGDARAARARRRARRGAGPRPPRAVLGGDRCGLTPAVGRAPARRSSSTTSPSPPTTSRSTPTPSSATTRCSPRRSGCDAPRAVRRDVGRDRRSSPATAIAGADELLDARARALTGARAAALRGAARSACARSAIVSGGAAGDLADGDRRRPRRLPHRRARGARHGRGRARPASTSSPPATTPPRRSGSARSGELLAAASSASTTSSSTLPNPV